jgi:hypothetical protein
MRVDGDAFAQRLVQRFALLRPEVFEEPAGVRERDDFPVRLAVEREESAQVLLRAIEAALTKPLIA